MRKFEIFHSRAAFFLRLLKKDLNNFDNIIRSSYHNFNHKGNLEFFSCLRNGAFSFILVKVLYVWMRVVMVTHRNVLSLGSDS